MKLIMLKYQSLPMHNLNHNFKAMCYIIITFYMIMMLPKEAGGIQALGRRRGKGTFGSLGQKATGVL